MGFLADMGDTVAASLDAIGIEAVLDPRNINPPCALVNPPLVEVLNGDGLTRFTYAVQLIAGGPANLDAIRQLYDMADSAIIGLDVTEARPVPVTVGSNTFPGYELTVVLTALPS